MTTLATAQSSFSFSGPSQGPPEVMAWWDRQRDLAVEWMLEVEAAGLAHHELARYAASSLFLVIEHRAIGHVPGEPIREPDSWDEIDAYEILFQVVGLSGGSEPFFDFEDVLRLIGSFADFLGRKGEIGPAEHAKLQEEYPLWKERLLEVWDNGAWYYRDGTYRPPLELVHASTQAAELERGRAAGTKGSGKKKRKERKKRRKRYGRKK